MADNLQKPSGARSASEALSKMKANRQRQTPITQSTQTSKPHITNNAAPRNNNKTNNNDDSGCGWILWFAVFFVIGFVFFSML